MMDLLTDRFTRWGIPGQSSVLPVGLPPHDRIVVTNVDLVPLAKLEVRVWSNWDESRTPPVEDRDVLQADEFLKGVYDLCLTEDTQAATDLVFERVDTLMEKGDFRACDTILSRVDVMRLDTFLMRSFLTITAPAKRKLPARFGLYRAAYGEIVRLKGEEYAKRLLGRLT